MLCTQYSSRKCTSSAHKLLGITSICVNGVQTVKAEHVLKMITCNLKEGIRHKHTADISKNRHSNGAYITLFYQDQNMYIYPINNSRRFFRYVCVSSFVGAFFKKKYLDA